MLMKRHVIFLKNLRRAERKWLIGKEWTENGKYVTEEE